MTNETGPAMGEKLNPPEEYEKLVAIYDAPNSHCKNPDFDVARARIAELEAENAKTSLILDKLATEWADKLDTMEDARDAALALLELAEAALAERDRMLEMLERGGVRIVSNGGSFTLAEFRQKIADLRAGEECADE